MKVKIVADSASDISLDLAEELGITIVPLNVQFGEQVFRDRVDLSTDEFYEKLQSKSVLPKTSAPAPGTFRDTYEKLAKETDAIVSIHISSQLSATCDAARLACAGLDVPVSVIDSETASMACGLLAIIAARAALQGAGQAEIEALLHDAIPRTITYGVFSTLDYLYKGGRIGKAQAFLGSVLKLSPILAISRGEVLPVARIRTRPKAIARMCEIVRGHGTIEEMSIMGTTNPKDTEDLANRLSPLLTTKRIYYTTIGPTIGTYVGPDAVGVSVIWKRG
ncbi:MAG TPA: DegV family protein [Dehalococcoidia bacterium]|nr:DegV family protein [Dehalococcoidia bacterium]